MKLYKNIDLQDLGSILKKGILPISVTGMDNWSSGKRAKNSKDVVYLFKPNNAGDAFPKYGMVLLEVDVDCAEENAMEKNDFYSGKYTEYTIKSVPQDKIIAAYIPDIFKDRIRLLPDDDRIHFCGITAEFYNHVPVDQKTFEQFSKTSPLNSSCCNFFRGVAENREIIDIYNVKYIF